MADSYLHHLRERDPDRQPLFRAPRAIAVPNATEVATRIDALARELAWSGPASALRSRRFSSG